MPIELQHKPIFMIGPERSGTTLVMALLSCHPNIAVPEVAWFYPRFRPYIKTYGDLDQDENLSTLLSEMIFGLKTPFWDMDVNPRTIVNELISTIKERSFAGAYEAILNYYANQHHKPRWGEKTPYNLFFVKEILEDFPHAQFINITRDGRDASADYLESSFGPTNIYCAAEIWKMCQQAVNQFRANLPPEQWFDVKYEDLVTQPETIMRNICDFLNEDYTEDMFRFHETPLAQRRGATRDHAPLGKPISDKYVGIYKHLLSVRDQQIFSAVAGKELELAGYEIDVDPIELSNEEIEKYIDFDSRIRAATLDSSDGHIVYESYNDWLREQREHRIKTGICLTNEIENIFPFGHRHEELITGYRAWRKWKDYFCIKRQYISEHVVL